MTRQSIIALTVALILGVVAVYLGNSFLSANERRADAASAGTVRVAVAAVPLDYGVQVTPEKVRFVNYPSRSVPDGSYDRIQTLLPAGKQRIALRPIEVNEPILASKLSGEGQNASIAALLPDGMRAAAVRINDVSGVAGFIQPNDSVDVLVTREVTGRDRSLQVTDVLLQNVRVMAMDQNATGDDGKPNLARTATLQVDPQEAQKLALAQQIGSLSLVLRKPGEEQNSPFIDTVSLGDLRYGRAAAPRMATTTATSQPAARSTASSQTRRASRPAPRRSAPRPVQVQSTSRSVDIVRGTENSSYEVGKYGS